MAQSIIVRHEESYTEITVPYDLGKSQFGPSITISRPRRKYGGGIELANINASSYHITDAVFSVHYLEALERARGLMNDWNEPFQSGR